MISFISRWLVLIAMFIMLLFLPIGIFMIIKHRKKRFGLVIGISLIIFSIPFYFIMSPLIIWKLDYYRGWELRLPVTTPNYEICLVQKPGFDFYDSYFEVLRSDNKKAIVIIDTDDSKWLKPDIVRKNSKIYFIRGPGQINDQTSYIDLDKDIIFSGIYKSTYRISELEFN